MGLREDCHVWFSPLDDTLVHSELSPEVATVTPELTPGPTTCTLRFLEDSENTVEVRSKSTQFVQVICKNTRVMVDYLIKLFNKCKTCIENMFIKITSTIKNSFVNTRRMLFMCFSLLLLTGFTFFVLVFMDKNLSVFYDYFTVAIFFVSCILSFLYFYLSDRILDASQQTDPESATPPEVELVELRSSHQTPPVPPTQCEVFPVEEDCCMLVPESNSCFGDPSGGEVEYDSPAHQQAFSSSAASEERFYSAESLLLPQVLGS